MSVPAAPPPSRPGSLLFPSSFSFLLHFMLDLTQTQPVPLTYTTIQNIFISYGFGLLVYSSADPTQFHSDPDPLRRSMPDKHRPRVQTVSRSFDLRFGRFWRRWNREDQIYATATYSVSVYLPCAFILLNFVVNILTFSTSFVIFNYYSCLININAY